MTGWGLALLLLRAGLVASLLVGLVVLLVESGLA